MKYINFLDFFSIQLSPTFCRQFIFINILDKVKGKPLTISIYINELPHELANNLLFENKGADQLAVTTKLISAFVSAKRIVQFVFYLYPKFQASSTFSCLCSSFCVGPVQKPHCWFSHKAAQICRVKFCGSLFLQYLSPPYSHRLLTL